MSRVVPLSETECGDGAVERASGGPTFFLVHIQKRNDGAPPHKVTQIHKFSNKNEVLEFLETVHPWQDYNGPDDKEYAASVMDVLNQGDAAWIWEWRRKGNGDYLSLVEHNGLSETNLDCPEARLEFLDGIDLDKSVDVD